MLHAGHVACLDLYIQVLAVPHTQSASLLCSAPHAAEHQLGAGVDRRTCTWPQVRMRALEQVMRGIGYEPLSASTSLKSGEQLEKMVAGWVQERRPCFFSTRLRAGVAC